MKKSAIIDKVKTLYKIRSLRFPMTSETVISIQGKNGFEDVTLSDYPDKKLIIADTGKLFGKTKIKYEQILK